MVEESILASNCTFFYKGSALKHSGVLYSTQECFKYVTVQRQLWIFFLLNT